MFYAKPHSEDQNPNKQFIQNFFEGKGKGDWVIVEYTNAGMSDSVCNSEANDPQNGENYQVIKKQSKLCNYVDISFGGGGGGGGILGVSITSLLPPPIMNLY